MLPGVVYPNFPDLSRAPAANLKVVPEDPTLRDTMENGMVTSRAKFTRRRRTWTVTYERLPPDDVAMLEQFVTQTVVYGALIFLFPDPYTDPDNQVSWTVRFQKIPQYEDNDFGDGVLRQKCSFELAEV